MYATAKNYQQLKQHKAASNTRQPKPKQAASNQSSMLNTTLVVACAQKAGKSSLKIQTKDKNATHGSITSSQKPARSNSRAKSACRGKSDIFNSTTPIKFFSNLEESIRDSQSRGPKSKITKADKSKDQMANS